jgi:hypothetical protein
MTVLPITLACGWTEAPGMTAGTNCCGVKLVTGFGIIFIGRIPGKTGNMVKSPLFI